MAITDVGTSQEFAYTGGIQSFVAPSKGLYKLEVWGASGAASGGAGGKGGYSSGYMILSKDQTLYIGVGGAGAVRTGGYNGGGTGGAKYKSGDAYKDGGGGGGATHIAIGSDRGVLKNYSSNKEEILIVAGGGGGGAYISSNYTGGSGGGASGGNATGRAVNPSGGTQTTGYSFGLGQNGGSATGSDWGESGRGGGGGGWYGGNASQTGNNGIAGGGGGSGYIGGVPEFMYKDATYTPTTSNGVQSGNGKAVITFIAQTFPPTYLGDMTIAGMYLGDVDVSDLKLH